MPCTGIKITASHIYGTPCLWEKTNISGFGENLLSDAPERELKDRSGLTGKSVKYSGTSKWIECQELSNHKINPEMGNSKRHGRKDIFACIRKALVSGIQNFYLNIAYNLFYYFRRNKFVIRKSYTVQLTTNKQTKNCFSWQRECQALSSQLSCCAV
jgi:hypothetical protein